MQNLIGLHRAHICRSQRHQCHCMTFTIDKLDFVSLFFTIYVHNSTNIYGKLAGVAT